MTPIYLDHAATTPLRAEVAEAIAAATAEGFANPSSPHAAGRAAKRLLEEARERVLAAAGGRTTGRHRDRLVFTSGATEANRLAIVGAASLPPGCVWHSARDHASVAAAARDLAARGWQAVALPLTAAGTVDLGAAPAAGPGILCGTLVCGQTGTLEDAARLRLAASARPDLRLHIDAAQAFAHEPVSFAELDASSLVLTPHKFGGPRGIGGLLVRADTVIAATQPGPQELGLRGGTEPVALAVGFAVAAELAAAARSHEAARMRGLRDELARRLIAVAREAGREAVVIGGAASRAPHILTIAFSGVDRQAFVMGADLEGVCCATGTACASGSSEPAPAIAALGLPAGVCAAAVRFSLGRETQADDVEAAARAAGRVLARFTPR